MAKTEPKKAEKKTVAKAPVTAKAIAPAIDKRLTLEQKRDRDTMLVGLKNSSDEDVKHVIQVYSDAPDLTKENMRIHYEKNGGLYINAIFNGDAAAAYKAAPEKDKKLF